MLSFFKELFASIKFNARERTTNVYIGALAFSWITINWKFWMILLFGDGTVDVRIEHVESLIGFSSGVVLPILMSAAICFILPKINKAITQYQNEPNNYVKRVNDISESKSLKRLARIERLRAKAASARDRENAAQELAIQQLNEQIQESKDQSQKLNQENEKLKQIIEEYQKESSDKDDQLNQLAVALKTKEELNNKLSQRISNATQEITTLKEQAEHKSLGLGVFSRPSISSGSLLLDGSLTAGLSSTVKSPTLDTINAASTEHKNIINAAKAVAEIQTPLTSIERRRNSARSPTANPLNSQPPTSDDLENK